MCLTVLIQDIKAVDILVMYIVLVLAYYMVFNLPVRWSGLVDITTTYGACHFNWLIVLHTTKKQHYRYPAQYFVKKNYRNQDYDK